MRCAHLRPWLNREMRIAVVAPPWAPIPPPLYGGIELIVDQLATGLVAAGHDVTLFATGDSTSSVPIDWILPEAEGMRIGMAVPEMRHIIHSYRSIADFDVVHDHTVLGPFYAERFPGIKVATTIHGPFNEELTDLYGALAGRVPIICISNSQRRAAPDLPIARVIHHGIDPSAFTFGNGDGDDDGEYLLFLGRMSPDKGAHRAVEAAKKAGVRLLLAAKMREPWERRYFEEYVEPFMGDTAIYLGEVPHERKLELLRGARALLFPIRWQEPFGLVMLEAFASGTPVIAFPEGAAPEVIEHGRTGYLCNDEIDMADAVAKLDEIDRDACRQAVEGYFSVGRMVEEHIELYEELIR